MWDSPLYTMNIFYYHWLIKKLLWPVAGQNSLGRKTKLNAVRKKAKLKKQHVAAEGDRHQNFTHRPQSHGKIQNNRNWLI